MKSGARPAELIAVASLIVLASSAVPQTSPGGSYSGSYLANDKGSSTLVVMQSDSNIEFTKTESGKTTKGSCPLHGGDGEYMSSGGVPGKCKAQIKPKSLILESVVAPRPDPSSPPVRMHTKEEWKLSADGKTLTIKSTVDFPDAPPGVAGVVSESIGSWTQKFVRTASE